MPHPLPRVCARNLRSAPLLPDSLATGPMPHFGPASGRFAAAPCSPSPPLPPAAPPPAARPKICSTSSNASPRVSLPPPHTSAGGKDPKPALEFIKWKFKSMVKDKEKDIYIKETTATVRRHPLDPAAPLPCCASPPPSSQPAARPPPCVSLSTRPYSLPPSPLLSRFARASPPLPLHLPLRPSLPTPAFPFSRPRASDQLTRPARARVL